MKTKTKTYHNHYLHHPQLPQFHHLRVHPHTDYPLLLHQVPFDILPRSLTIFNDLTQSMSARPASTLCCHKSMGQHSRILPVCCPCPTHRHPSTYEYAVNTWGKFLEDYDGGGNEVSQRQWHLGLTDLLEDRQAVKCRWVYLTKCDTHGDVTHYCAHLIAKGFSQTTGIDYEETFAPSQTWLLEATAIACSKLRYGSAPYQHRIGLPQQRFGWGIYMDQLKGFMVPEQESKVCCLRKALYGLKQEGQQCHQH